MEKRSDTVLVNEFLAFVQNKLDVMDEVSLAQIITTSYTEADILAAKRVLADTATSSSVRLVTRQRDGTGKKDLQDIFRMFKEVDPDDIPTYVAKDLFKLPPVTWDHVDTTRVLKDIMLLRADVTELKKKLEESETKVTELQSEIVALRSSAAQAKLPSPASTQNVTMRRPENRNARLSIPAASNDANTTQGNDRHCTPKNTKKRNTETSLPKLPMASSVLSVPPRKQKKSYAQVVDQPVHVTKDQTDSEGFTLVKKRHPRPNRNQRGTATGTTMSLQVVPPTVKIYLSRLDTNTKGEEVLRYIRERLGQGEGRLGLSLERLEQSRPTDFKSYALQVPAKYKKMFLAPEFWPAGVVYRIYREKRMKFPTNRSASFK